MVDVWTGWSDRHGRVPWSADTAPMVFVATKGVTSTVIHRLAVLVRRGAGRARRHGFTPMTEVSSAYGHPTAGVAAG